MTSWAAHPRVEEWSRSHPQEWGAFNQVPLSKDMRERVLAAILAEREEDEAIRELTCLAEAMENNEQAARAGVLVSPPPIGERRPVSVRIRHMTRMRNEEGVYFRVAFSTPQGWSGHFDTTAPEVVEKISKHRHRSRCLTVVGEVISHPYDFMVVLGGRVRIV